ncbi:hypothetical protein NQ176_g578 [Zarea fungicola]|uniref:Uncharacterized protein n=1 Tax=Zarea fungicola TaxID=93591 RepID=A0ACC1NXJ9_9HYPO|nr:hypothetical protein NQ176_g578 [Lecanicillium fungicola]
MAQPTILLDLAETVSRAALTITRNQLTSVSKDGVNGASNGKAASTPLQETLEANTQLIQAANDLLILVMGPDNYLKSLSYGYHDITALAVVVEFDLANHVPLGSEISIKDLATASGAPYSRLERVLRLLFVRKIFFEPKPGYVAHTVVSERLSTDPELTAFLGHCTHEAFPAASRLIDSLRKYPDSEGPSQTGFNIAFGTEDPLFNFLVKNPDRFDRFNRGMAGLSKHGGRSLQSVIEIYPWDTLGSAVCVDLGGGNGHVSVALAEKYPKLSFIVQDLEVAVQAGRDALPDNLKGRVQFEAHDMFQDQTRQDVDVFYLRHILHDWPDDYAVEIIKKIVPALKKESKILVSDSVIPPPHHLHGLHEKFVRYLDMQMMVLHNARERTEEDFALIFNRADPRLQIRKVWRTGHDAGAGTLIEVGLD